MPLIDIWKTKQPFCRLCARYMTPAAAKKHTKHARAIKWPKK
jgi:hypothetical protein